MEKKLLVIEDDTDISNIIQELVADLFTTVDKASSQEEALELLSKNTYSMIFLDYNLDFKSGPEIISIMKRTPNNPNNKTPIVLVSGLLTPNFAGEHAGQFVKIIAKPFDNKEIIDIVKATLK